MRGFDVAQDYHGLKEVADRSAFLVDGHGIIRGRWRYETRELPDFDELLAGLGSVS